MHLPQRKLTRKERKKSCFSGVKEYAHLPDGPATLVCIMALVSQSIRMSAVLTSPFASYLSSAGHLSGESLHHRHAVFIWLHREASH